MVSALLWSCEVRRPWFKPDNTYMDSCVRIPLISFAAPILDYVIVDYQRYSVIPSIDAAVLGLKGLSLQVLDNKYNLPWRYYVGILGMSGQTAYYGLKDISNPKPGETLYISAACGAVGQYVSSYHLLLFYLNIL